MKVFVSSVIQGMERERQAARLAIESLDATPLMAELVPAGPATPQGACFSLAEAADVVVVLFGERYGSVLPSGVSATEDECRHARKNSKPVLAFVTSSRREERQEAFLKWCSTWERGVLRAHSPDHAALQKDIVRALRGLMSSVDLQESLVIAQAALRRVELPTGHGAITGTGAWIAAACVPEQRIAVDEEWFFENMPVVVGDSCVTGAAPLTNERPQVTSKTEGLQFGSPAANLGAPRLKGWLGTRLDVAIGGVFQRRSRERFEDSMFARPSDATAVLARQLEVMHELIRRLDQRNVVQRCALQVSLGNLGIANFAEANASGSSGIPINMDGAERVQAFEEPTSILASEMIGSSGLSAKIVSRLRRAVDSGRR